MAIGRWPTKDPNDLLDYQIDWLGDETDQGFLYGTNDTIDTSTWIVPDGITSEAETSTDSTTTIWLSGGTAGETYQLTNRITTTDGRTKDKSMKLPVKEQ